MIRILYLKITRLIDISLIFILVTHVLIFNFDMFLNRLSETVIFETGLSTNGPLTTEPLAIELV